MVGHSKSFRARENWLFAQVTSDTSEAAARMLAAYIYNSRVLIHLEEEDLWSDKVNEKTLVPRTFWLIGTFKDVEACGRENTFFIQ